MTASVVFLIMVLLFISVKIIIENTKRRNRLFEEYILKNSIAIQELCSLNHMFSFESIDALHFTYTYDSDFNYEAVSCYDYLLYQLRLKETLILNQIFAAQRNYQKYLEYQNKIANICQFGNYSISNNKYSKDKLLAQERIIFNQLILHPTINFSINVNLFLATMSGRIIQNKQQLFNSEEIREMIFMLNDRTGYFYNNRDVWDSITRVERGRVSNKMRFAIYKRDKYRCRNCGASGESVALEIDHIVPIAKGGKSTFDNLQTLCHRCNMEKGDSMPFQGE